MHKYMVVEGFLMSLSLVKRSKISLQKDFHILVLYKLFVPGKYLVPVSITSAYSYSTKEWKEGVCRKKMD